MRFTSSFGILALNTGNYPENGLPLQSRSSDGRVARFVSNACVKVEKGVREEGECGFTGERRGNRERGEQLEPQKMRNTRKEGVDLYEAKGEKTQWSLKPGLQTCIRALPSRKEL